MFLKIFEDSQDELRGLEKASQENNIFILKWISEHTPDGDSLQPKTDLVNALKVG